MKNAPEVRRPLIRNKPSDAMKESQMVLFRGCGKGDMIDSGRSLKSLRGRATIAASNFKLIRTAEKSIQISPKPVASCGIFVSPG